MPLSVQGQNQIETDIRFLSDDARDGRGVGTPGLDAGVSYAAHRYVHDTKNGRMVIDQGNIDREFTVPLDKFLRAVEWIYEPESFPPGSLSIWDRCGFLRPDRNLGGQLFERALNQSMRSLVRSRQRRIIILCFNIEIGFVYVQYFLAREAADGNHRFDEVGQIRWHGSCFPRFERE